MKFIVALQNKMNSIQAKAFDCLKKKEGQNTIEYVLMLVVVVGVAGLAGVLIKKFMPDLFEQVKAKITGSMNEM
jgi:undecaprenyl pyrophosphate phosphatase UppP